MRVVVVDDHHAFRTGVQFLLSSVNDMVLVGEASQARDAFSVIERERPQVVLMDMALPGMDGVAATREIRVRFPEVHVLIVTVHDQVGDVLDALGAGATGYALKTETMDALVLAIRTVGGGERYLTPTLARTVARYEARRRPTLDVLEILSLRERAVFRLAADCLLAREIAAQLGISRKTVDTHLHRIHRKLDLRGSAELVRLAAGLAAARAASQRWEALEQSPPAPLESGREPGPDPTRQRFSPADEADL
jgi:DNA-binding NarL/FixJ family response regulator